MATDGVTRRPIKIVHSYPHKNERYRAQLENHRSRLKRRGLIDDWQDRKIAPGDEWAESIDANLEAADLIRLLVSADFIASDYFKTTEDNGGVHVNAGIPNHAFYRAAIAMGAYAGEKAGRIWYDAVCNGPLTADSKFSDFARRTTVHGTKLFGRSSAELDAVVGAWTDVGIDVRKAAAARRPKAKRGKTTPQRRATTTARRVRR